MIKNISKRFLSFLLVLAVLFAAIPAGAISAFAASGSLSMSAEGLTATFAGDGSWSGGGTTASGSVTGGKNNCNKDEAKSANLTFTNGRTTEATISFDYNITKNTGSVTIYGTTVDGSGSFSEVVAPGDTVQIVINSGAGTSKTTAIDITNISMVSDATATTTFKAPENGTYTVNGEAITADTAKSQSSTDAYALVAAPATGYSFIGWYSTAVGSYISYEATTSVNIEADTTIYPVFVSADTPVFQVGNSLYTDFSSANTAALADSSKTMKLFKNGTLPAGTYEISADVKLLIPYSAADSGNFSKDTTCTQTVTTPSMYSCLTLAEGAVINCYGSINANAQQYSNSGRNTGFVSGGYGAIHMTDGSQLNLKSGSTLYAYGYVGGEGLVWGESGSSVYQFMQMMDWRGGNDSSSLLSSLKGNSFIFSQYYLQNIEATLRIDSGCVMYGSATIAVGLTSNKTPNQTCAAIVGKDTGMFHVTDGYAMMKYNADTDRMELDFYGALITDAISMSMKLNGLISSDMNTRDFILGLPMNYTINIKSGSTVTFAQKFKLLPGTVVNVEKGANATIATEGALYLYDVDDWNAGTYAYNKTIYQLTYVYARKDKPVERKVTDDAVLKVDGTLTANGPVYSTKATENGGNAGITGNGAFVTAAYGSTDLKEVVTSNSTELTTVACVPVVGTIAGYEGQQSFALGTHVSFNGDWYRFTVKGDVALVSGGIQDGGIIYVGSTKDSTGVTVTSAQPCVTVTNSTIAKNADGSYAISNITGNVVVTTKEHNIVADAAVAPDCTNNGLTEGTHCADCGEVLSAQGTVPALGHTEEVVEGKAPTCTETGLTEGKKCSVCGITLVEQNVIPALGHTDENDLAVAPTCTETGLTAGTHCSVCGVVTAKQEVVAALGHDHSVIVEGTAVNATCTESGKYADMKCVRCDDTVAGEVIPATGHNHSLVVEGSSKAPTCTESGKELDLKCANCDDVLEGAVIPATGHDAVVDAAVAPTCTETGLTEGSHCETCGDVLVAQETVAALGHNYVDVVTAPTCTAQGYTTHTCSRCGDAYVDGYTAIESDNHNYDSQITVNPTCTTEGYTADVCSICGHNEVVEGSEKTAYGHDYTYGVLTPTCTEGGHTVRTCVVCDYSDIVDVVEALGHDCVPTVTYPSCTEQGYTTHNCSRCDYTHIPADSYKQAYAHQYEYLVCSPTCTEGGYTVFECMDCGTKYIPDESRTEPYGHHYDFINVTDPTCTEDGYTTYTCYCGESYVDNHISALGCNYGDWVVTTAPTCTEGGEREKTCSRCGDTVKETLPATGHSHTPVVTAPTCTEGGYTTYTCHCGNTYTDNIVPAKGHTTVTDLAVAPTCSATGLTEGSHCSDCGTVLVAQQTVEKTAHKFGEWAMSKLASCVAEGEETRYCSACNATETRATAKLAHTPVTDPAVAARYDKTGLTEGSHCSACGTVLVAQTVVPMLTVNWEVFKLSLKQLETYAIEYAESNPGKDPLKLMINFIRTGVERYTDEEWTTLAGPAETVFINEVLAKDDINGTHAYALRQIDGKSITVPSGEEMVFDHLFGALNVSSKNNYTTTNTDFGSWAGDICDLMEYVNENGLTSTDVEAMTNEIGNKYFLVDSGAASGFGIDDLRADLDAFYIVSKINGGNTSLANIAEEYYVNTLSVRQRAAYFLNNRFAGSLTKAAVREAVHTTYKDHFLIQLLESGRGLSDKHELREACCYAFADYLYNLAKEDLVAPETPDDTPEEDPNHPDVYKVFNSSKSTLAPGVTQHINYAIDSTGQQMVYYTATVDINRDDVNLYANYTNNDASTWAMSPVSEQMKAAQKKHSNPDDKDNYIPNYNVVVGQNANFYNMSTGQPSGLFVMGGKTYTTGRNFFAILKDGTPVIAAEGDYNKYADDIQEGVGGGRLLLLDGESLIAETEKGKMPRSVIGITKDGQIVMMVVDGRQAPFSEGASYYEVAQILLDIGCVAALELDGGGSATFDAKQEGSDEITVVNRPCDTVERSVSGSLMVVSTAVVSYEFDHALVSTPTDYITLGSQFDVELTGVSSSGHNAEIPENAVLTVSDSSKGTVSGNTFTATAVGKTQIQLTVDGKVVGSKEINVIRRPDALKFTENTLNLIYGVAEELPLVATYENNPVTISTNDIVFDFSSAAGVMDGFAFIGDEASGIRNVTVTAKVKTNVNITAAMNLRLYSSNESIFDFGNATAGNESLAWNREVTNSVTVDGSTYYVVDRNSDTLANYTFAMDMKAIKAPARLQPLMEYLNGFAGNIGDDASPWDYLLALGNRVSELTNVTIQATFPEDVDVDVSNLAFVNDFMSINSYSFNDATRTLSITCGWIKQGNSEGIDPATANSIAILSGVKLIPNMNARSASVINADITGNVTYDIYLDTSQLHSFAKDPANQEKYGIYDYINPNDSEDAGGHFKDTYITFEDHFTLYNEALNGWVTGGVDNDLKYYYVDNEMVTGVYKATDLEGGNGSYYYDFGTDGILVSKYTGLFFDETVKAYRYARFGELQSGWVDVNSEWYYFYPDTMAAKAGSMKFGPVTYELEETGKLSSGVWAKTLFGNRYYYGPKFHVKGWQEIDGKDYFFQDCVALTGGYQQIYYNGNIRLWHYFNEDGSCDRDYIIPDGFYTDRNGYGYSKNGEGLIDLHMIDGDYYYFNYLGYAQKGTYRGRLFGDDYKAFTGITEKDGKLYCYTEGRTSTYGLFKIDGDYYFANWGGVVMTSGKYYVGTTFCDLPAGNYEFGADGKMLNGIVEKDGTLYHYKNGVTGTYGLIKVGDDYYFSNWGGVIRTSGKYYVGTTYCDLPVGNYEFGADGKMLRGIVEKDGTLYHYVNGLTGTYGLVKVGDDYYFSNWGGVIRTSGQYYVGTTYCDLPVGNYEFGADGKMLRGIVEKDGTLYYYKNGLTGSYGLVKVGDDYYFSNWGGVIRTSGQYYVGTTFCDLPVGNYEFGADGKMLNGIVEKDGTLYYYKNGLTGSYGLIKIGDDYYFSNWGGVIRTNGQYYVGTTYCDLPVGNYEFGADGKMLHGIVERDGKKYFYNNGLTAPNGLFEANGKYYYATWGGELKTDGRYYIEKSYCDLPGKSNYTFDENGEMLDGFVTIDGTIYYYKNGNTPRPGIIKVDGDYYYVNWGGVIVTNKTYYVSEGNGYTIPMNYTFDATGKIIG